MGKNDLEDVLLEQLKYKSGLDRNKLSELVGIATKLLKSVETKTMGISVEELIPWWWILGTPDPDRLVFKGILETEQLQGLISAISNMPEVKNALGSLEFTPGLAKESAWLVTGSFGAKGPIAGNEGSFGTASQPG